MYFFAEYNTPMILLPLKVTSSLYMKRNNSKRLSWSQSGSSIESLVSSLRQLTVKHGLKNRTADRQHELVSRNHLFTFAFTIHLANNELDIAETIVVENKLGSLFDGWSCHLPVFFSDRHGFCSKICGESRSLSVGCNNSIYKSGGNRDSGSFRNLNIK